MTLGSEEAGLRRCLWRVEPGCPALHHAGGVRGPCQSPPPPIHIKEGGTTGLSLLPPLQITQQRGIGFLNWRSLTNLAGSGSKSHSPRDGSADPDPCRNVTDPPQLLFSQYWYWYRFVASGLPGLRLRTHKNFSIISLRYILAVLLDSDSEIRSIWTFSTFQYLTFKKIAFWYESQMLFTSFYPIRTLLR